MLRGLLALAVLAMFPPGDSALSPMGGRVFLSDVDAAFVGMRFSLVTESPTITITSPADDPHTTSTTPKTVSGTTTGPVATVTFSSTGGDSDSCSTGAGTFSCSVDLAAGGGNETVTVNANSGAATDTVVITYTPTPLFDLNPSTSGVGSLPVTLVVNSVTMTPVLDCDAQDISGTNWACDTGGTLASAGSGSDPAIDKIAPFLDTSESTRVAASNKYWEGTSTPQVTTEDIAIEVVFRPTSTTTAGAIVGQLTGGATDAGWELGINSGSNGTVRLGGGAGAYSSVDCFTSLATGTSTLDWRHLLVFWDRSETSGTDGLHCYRGGTNVASSFLNIADVTSGSRTMRIGHGNTGGSDTTTNADFALVRVWKCAGCFVGGGGNAAQWQAVATDRSARLWGLYPSTAGTAAPTTVTRATRTNFAVANTGTGVFSLFQGAANWVSTSRYKEDAGGEYAGCIPVYPQTTNLLLQSEDLATTWTLPTAGDAVAVNTVDTPNGLTTADPFDAVVDAVGLEHCAEQVSSTLTAATYSFSTFLKAGQQTVAFLRDATIANGVAWFNLSTCTAGTAQAGVTARAENWGNGWCRVGVFFTATAAAHTLDICGASADGALTYIEAADATTDWTAWGGVLVAGNQMPPYIATTTAAVTRNADDLRYSATSNASAATGTLAVKALAPNINLSSDRSYAFIGDASTNNNRVHLYADVSDVGESDGDSAGVTQWDVVGTSDPSDGELHELRTSWTTNAASYYFDLTSQGTPDTSATVPVSFSSIFVGENRSAGQQAGACLSRVRVWNVQTVTP